MSDIVFSSPTFANGVLSFQVLAGQAIGNFDLVFTYDSAEIQSGDDAITVSGPANWFLASNITSAGQLTISGAGLDPIAAGGTLLSFSLKLSSASDTSVTLGYEGTYNDPAQSIAASSVTLISTTPANQAPVLSTPAALSYTDTSADDTFVSASGTLAATDADGNTLTYGISGSTVSSGTASKVGSYGTLTLNTSTGAYTYTPNDSAIEALRSNASDSFTFSASDGQASATASLVVNLTGANDTPTGNVSIIGTATQGQTLSVSNTLADREGMGTVSYQWLANGQAITGATASSLTLGQAQVGKTIAVRISYTDNQGTAESVTSSATGSVANVNDAPTGSVTISGVVKEGQTLLASASTLADADGLGTISYQWQASTDGTSWSNLGTGSSFTLGQAQVGQSIRVVASYTDGFQKTEQVSSTPSSTVRSISDTGTTVDFLAYSWKQHVLLDSVDIREAGANPRYSDNTGVDHDGKASFASVSDASLNLNASRAVASAETTATNAAVNLQDAIAILKMIVGLPVNGTNQPMSPYQAYAADYDGNGTVALTDAIGVLKHVVGLTAPDPQWVFFNEADTTVAGKYNSTTKTVTDPTHPGTVPTLTANLSGVSPVKVGLVGVLRGDVDGSYMGGGTLDMDAPQSSYANYFQSTDHGLNPVQFGVYS